MAIVTIASVDYEVYADVATADAYLAADLRLNAIWSAATADDKARAMVTATRLLNRQSWQGTANPLAIGILTLTANPLDTETVTIGSKVYTYQSVLTDVDGNVLIGADADASIVNLIVAINLGAGSGTAYAASTTLNTDVSAEAISGSRLLAVSKTAGATSVATTTTVSGASWGASTLAASSLAWPRSSVTDADGNAVDDDSIPQAVIDGFITLSALIVENPSLAEASDTGSNIERVQAGSVQVEFFRPQFGTRFPTILHELFGEFLESALAGSAGSRSFGADATSTTPASNSFGTDFGLFEGYG